MTESGTAAGPIVTVEQMQKEWPGLRLRVEQLEAANKALEKEVATERALLERVIEHRQRSHSELVLLLTGLVSRLPMHDVGVVVSKLVEHNTHTVQYLAALAKGTAGSDLPQPVVLQNLEQTRHELLEAIRPLVQELLRLETPLEKGLLQPLMADPEQFFSAHWVRANRCFLKGQVPRERIVRDFGQPGLALFNDLTTDPKLNPRPKPEEIVLGFKDGFESLLQQQTSLAPEKREALAALYRCVQRSKTEPEPARTQRIAFQKLSFLIELLHYYEHQSTESPDLLFAQRLPALVEQMVLGGPGEALDEAAVAQAESILDHVASTEHRQMIINNLGKNDTQARTLKFLLKLRTTKTEGADPIIAEFIRHSLPTHKPPPAAPLAALLRLLPPEVQPMVVKAFISCERLTKEDADALGKALCTELGFKNLVEEVKAQPALPPEVERQMAWAKIKELMTGRTDAVTVAAAMRERLNSKYNADEIRQSWLTLIEAEPLSLIRVFCQLPYKRDGSTDAIARPVLESYVTRLMHEKYAATYRKIVNSLRNLFAAKADSPPLVNFIALVRWVAPDAAERLSRDVGIPAPAH
jgi:hypothetical protein